MFAEAFTDEAVNLDWSSPGLPLYNYRASPFKFIYRSSSGEIFEEHSTRSAGQCNQRADPSIFSVEGELVSVAWPDPTSSRVVLVPEMRGELYNLNVNSGCTY